ncbi:hypothetical protein OG271_29775 [Micromonospora rifamycinica]|uniref:hypothetical protein n=1 Tax=Micromonospora rifamycinica TaxID=291594 RepID=UPI002E2BE3B9|nr:hypothetical protein [Micromonospora rifamycinica]
MTSSPAGTPAGDRVHRIHWLPGTDTLRGVCHCGAERVAVEPVALWEWLLGHPRDHQDPVASAGDRPVASAEDRPAVRA